MRLNQENTSRIEKLCRNGRAIDLDMLFIRMPLTTNYARIRLEVVDSITWTPTLLRRRYPICESARREISHRPVCFDFPNENSTGSTNVDCVHHLKSIHGAPFFSPGAEGIASSSIQARSSLAELKVAAQLQKRLDTAGLHAI